MRSKCAVPAEAWLSCVATARNRVSLTKVDLPDPETPVTQVSNPNGNSVVTFFRLLAVAPTTRSMRFGSGARRFAGISMRRRPLKYCPVFDHDDRVAEIAQVDERVEQTLVVALVQSDRRLIENVHDADQP